MSKPFVPDTPQILMRNHLRKHDHALLFVGMGVGKTASCLLTIRELLRELEIRSVLVVAPLRVANLTWPEEVRDWKEFSWMKVANLRTRRGKEAFLRGSAHIYTINYESLPMLCNLVASNKGEIPYDVIIFDELTKAKNPQSKRINRFRNKVPRPKHVWGLTGTPTPNSLMDLFAQVRLVDGGQRLGENFMRYKNAFFEKADYMGYSWRIKEGAQGTIEGAISDITLTLRSKDWVDIPEPEIIDEELTMGEETMADYLKFEKELILELKQGGEITAANAAVLVTKLLQFTSGAAYDVDRNTLGVHDTKMEALRRIYTKADGPVLVAVNFQHEQDRIRKAFPHARFFRDAKTPESLATLVRDWNEGKIMMLVAHPKSVGHGLNLQRGGRRMVWFTLGYSREDYEQMICRLARRGQTGQVVIHRLICKDTIDEVVCEVLANKASTEHKLLRSLAMLEELRDNTP